MFLVLVPKAILCVAVGKKTSHLSLYKILRACKFKQF